MRYLYRYSVGTVTLMLAMYFLASNAIAQTGTTVTFPWDWHISVSPNIGGGTGEIPGPPVPIWLWGTATVNFTEPVRVGGDTTAPPTFDLGPGGVGFDTPTAEPPPLGGIYQIQTEIIALELHSMGQVQFPGGFSDVIIRNSPNQRSVGALNNLQNNGDGTISVDSFFDIFFEIELPQLGMTLMSGPVDVGMSFGDTPLPDPRFGPPGPPLEELDVLWAPTWIWREFPPGQSPPWVDSSFHPWDWWVTIHGHVTVPEPGTVGLMGFAIFAVGLAVARKRKAA